MQSGFEFKPKTDGELLAKRPPNDNQSWETSEFKQVNTGNPDLNLNVNGTNGVSSDNKQSGLMGQDD